MKSSIDDNVSLNKNSVTIPTLTEIEDRFFDINVRLYVKVDAQGYIPELNGLAPFNGICSVKNIINMLNRDIAVHVKDEDLVKLRNSIIYYNEYFIPSEKNIQGYKVALTAFERIESQYTRALGISKTKDLITNPFKLNVMEGIGNDDASVDYNSVMDNYIAKKRKEDASIKSSKLKDSTNLKSQISEPTIPLHSLFCRKMARVVDFENLEWCFEDVKFID